MNYFAEGLQGAGKSTLVKRLSQICPEYEVYREGDYSPVELAWCAYLNEEEYEDVLKRHHDLSDVVREKTYAEDDHKIVCYTKIKTDDRGFYRDLENYEIYNGRKELSEFEQIVLGRYERYHGDDAIFECSLFQNTVEDMILFRDMRDEQIVSFYREVSKALEDIDYKILYLKSDDIKGNIEQIRKERIDDKGREIWYELMLDYFDHSPHAALNQLSGEDGLLEHLQHRQDLELWICEEIFKDHCVILSSRNYDLKKTDL